MRRYRTDIQKKLAYCAPLFWKKIHLYLKYPVLKPSEKRIFNRSSIIPLTLANNEVKIYTGKSWHKRFLTAWSVGFKFGELTWNRRIALYKAKQLKKKKKK